MLKTFAGALAFGLELALLWACGAWAFHQVTGLPLKIAAALGLALAVAAFWGLLLAPMAKRRLPVPARGAAKFLLFAAGAWMAWAIGDTIFALVFGALAAVSLALEYGLRIKAV